MARQQQLIDRILDEKEQRSDHSLQGKARDRALGGAVPKTLTPWEWEQWYAEHGTPDAHRVQQQTSRKPWWRRLL